MAHPKMPVSAPKNGPELSPDKARRSAVPKGFVRAALLLLLLEQPAHGYELLERLEPFGVQRADTGGLYRNLRALESAGLVRSDWRQSAAGPARHVYQITHAGREELHSHAKGLAATLQLFLSRYLEFVDLTSPTSTRSAPGKPAARRSRKRKP
jgi:poly-beta-hydroxybutyrate-responsive repressor